MRAVGILYTDYIHRRRPVEVDDSVHSITQVRSKLPCTSTAPPETPLVHSTPTPVSSSSRPLIQARQKKTAARNPHSAFVMKARYKCPSGTGVVEFNDKATVRHVFDEIRTKTGITHFTLKYGPPTTMKTIGQGDYDHGASSLGLNGETLTVVPDETRPTSRPAIPDLQSSLPPQESVLPQARRTQSGDRQADIVIPWPEREGTLCERPFPASDVLD